MDILKLVECHGYTKAEAFQNLNFNPDPPMMKGSNCTLAWTQQGKPIPGTQQFRLFAIQQLEEKTQLKPGYGLYITLQAPVPDVRKRPYTIINNKVNTTRQWSNIKYMIVEADFVINSFEIKTESDDDDELVEENIDDVTVMRRKEIIEICDSLTEAKQKMKELTSLTHRNYLTMAVKIPDISADAAYCLYTPSSNAKEGQFLAFGIDADINDGGTKSYTKREGRLY